MMENCQNQENKQTERKPRKNLLRHPNEMPKNKVLYERYVAVEEEDKKYREITDKLQQLTNKTGMPIVQENGQRTYGPPRNWEGPPPPKGCEVFVGKLPRSVYEPHLVPLFETCGPIYELRLMMDFSGENRGFCFVQYTKPSHAQQAIRDLNNYEIRKGRKIGVVKSMDNCRLFIGGIPTDKTEKDIHKEMDKITEGVRRVIVYHSPGSGDKSSKNRGFAFVEYESHKSAAMARRKMIPGKITMWGLDVTVDWAEPEPDVKVLYVGNLAPTTTEASLKSLFDNVSNNGVDRVEKRRDGALVHFVSREQADTAKQAMNEQVIDGYVVKVIWAKSAAPATRNTDNDNKGVTKTGRMIQGHASPNNSPGNSPKRGGRTRDSSIPQFGYPKSVIPCDRMPPPFYLPASAPNMMNRQQNYFANQLPSHLMQQSLLPFMPQAARAILNGRQEMASPALHKPIMDYTRFYSQNALWGY